MDTTNLIKGNPTKTGKETYLFYNKDGKVINVMLDTAEKNNYKPVIKGNHKDGNMSELEYIEPDLTDKPISLDDLDELQKRQLQKIKEKKDNTSIRKVVRKQSIKEENEINEIIPQKQLSESEKAKKEELIAKRDKIDKQRAELNEKNKKDIELKKKKEEEVLRLQDIREEHNKQIIKQTQTTDDKPEENAIQLERKKLIIDEMPKQKTLQEKLVKKNSSIVNHLFDDSGNPFKKFIETNNTFEIFYNGNLIYTSKNTDKERINLYDDHFELFGKRYPYAGLRFKKLKI